MSSKKGSRHGRDEVPLLSRTVVDSSFDGAVQIHFPNAQANSRSMAAINLSLPSKSSKKKRGLIVRLLAPLKRKQPAPPKSITQKQQSTQSQSNSHVRPIASATTTSTSTTNSRLPEVQQNTFLRQTHSRANASPPRLEMPRKDTVRKLRPFPVPLRRRRNNNALADDPPDIEQSRALPSLTTPAAATGVGHNIASVADTISPRHDDAYGSNAKHSFTADDTLLQSEQPRNNLLFDTKSIFSLTTSKSETTTSSVQFEQESQLSTESDGALDSLLTPEARQSHGNFFFSDATQVASASVIEEKKADEDATALSTPRRSGIDWPYNDSADADENDESPNGSNSNTNPSEQNDNLASKLDTHISSHHKSELLPMEQRILALLNRPFGRAHLPVDIARRYVAEVSQAEWDADEHKWKYRVLLQNRNLQLSPRNDQIPQSFTTAFTWRSLADFLWLEKALHHEFHGGLLLPDLNIALGRAVDSNLEGMPVEADRLKHWLNDVLNGIRGQGELILDHETVDILYADAMERFLYQSGGPLEDDDDSIVDHKSAKRPHKPESFLQALWNRPLSMVPLDFCVGPDTVIYSSRADTRAPPLGYAACASGALGNSTSYDAQDSIMTDHITVVSSASTRPSSVLAIHSIAVDAEGELASIYRKTALSAMEKLQVLKEEEDLLGQNWKRFAECLSNLFAYEKNVESAKLCGLKICSEKVPFSQVKRGKIEDGLRVLADHKNQRVVPALEELQTMLAAFVADLSAAEPSISAFKAATNDLHDAEYVYRGEAFKKDVRPVDQTLSQDGLLSKKPLDLIEDDCSETGSCELVRHLRAHERLLQRSLTELCRGVPIRISRMFWRLWKTEATECALIIKAANVLKSNTDVRNGEAVARMKKRHLNEEKEDSVIELDVINRLLTLGSSGSNETGNKVTNMRGDGDNNVKMTKLLDHQHVLHIARARTGRWDEKLTRAIMEAIDVKDPDVRVEETSKELRLVRRYAFGLRQQVSQCLNALERILVSYVDASKLSQGGINKRDDNSIQRRRRELLIELSKLCRSKFLIEKDRTRRSAQMLAILSRVGVVAQELNVDELAMQVLSCRDSQTEWLLRSMRELLMDYFNRVEVIESFVYMERVGIQIENYFSRRRAESLADFEKKTDLTAAINAAKRKASKKVVHELQAKLDMLASDVSHTKVKAAKDVHLGAKKIKAELHDLAIRSLTRSREGSTERIVGLISIWAEEEGRSATTELTALKAVMDVMLQQMSALSVEAMIYRVAD
ncbi:hypothetical protein MPSEU_000733900 [Mayamaea pseudoterrestris]|nr:hypothetical protein MPSEU_000733900 [Mayamaea pseudoterrestris]